MQTTTSADGTTIAFDLRGDGPTVVVVNGALSTARDAAGLAASLAEAGCRAVTYDRRARGGSGDTRPYAPAREVDDVRAVIDAVGGRAVLLGHSSGAVLALVAAGAGVPTGHVFCSEPPFRFAVDEPPSDLADRMQALLDAGRPDEVVLTFQREAVGLPEPVIEQVRAGPGFAALAALAQSCVYDVTLTAEVPVPTSAMLAVGAPVTVLCGEQTFLFLAEAARRLAAAVPGAELVVVPESVQHRLDPAATARVVATRLLRPPAATTGAAP